MDKNLFLKNMEEMIAIAKTNGNQIDHKELLDYFSDYNLNEEAKKLLIASFIEAGIRVLGVDEISSSVSRIAASIGVSPAEICPVQAAS